MVEGCAQVVAYADRDPAEVYTLSAGGVTLALPGAAAEFTSLERWLAEAAAFAQLRTRPAFRGFRAWKRFRIWWRTVRLEKVAAARAALEGSLVVQVRWLGCLPTSHSCKLTWRPGTIVRVAVAAQRVLRKRHWFHVLQQEHVEASCLASKSVVALRLVCVSVWGAQMLKTILFVSNIERQPSSNSPTAGSRAFTRLHGHRRTATCTRCMSCAGRWVACACTACTPRRRRDCPH